ncbi:hypothetical protein HAZT_HAZT002165 [Hyalella azteca]|uniref:Uncharacterized protein n=1 Tax=Hyalella azteca TaxID=294128 RepID=A0A6A0GV46_HYAAZ|nr:hypothetical protein HAZT_HAZT002165 [Hyalella azteca]
MSVSARKVYVCGQLVYSLGMVLLATTPTRTAVIVLSTTAGVMYSTLFTMPYLLVAHYHATQTFIQALCMGSFVSAYGSTAAVVIAAAVFSFCGAMCATQVEYLDL